MISFFFLHYVRRLILARPGISTYTNQVVSLFCKLFCNVIWKFLQYFLSDMSYYQKKIDLESFARSKSVICVVEFHYKLKFF